MIAGLDLYANGAGLDPHTDGAGLDPHTYVSSNMNYVTSQNRSRLTDDSLQV